MNPLEAFPGGADEAREFIDAHRDARDDRKCALCNLALLGLDSLAADPEREAKVERAIKDLVAAAMHMERDGSYAVVDYYVRSRERLLALFRAAPPSPSVAALREAVQLVVSDLTAYLSERDVPTTWAMQQIRDKLVAALAASNANARGSE